MGTCTWYFTLPVWIPPNWKTCCSFLFHAPCTRLNASKVLTVHCTSKGIPEKLLKTPVWKCLAHGMRYLFLKLALAWQTSQVIFLPTTSCHFYSVGGPKNKSSSPVTAVCPHCCAGQKCIFYVGRTLCTMHMLAWKASIKSPLQLLTPFHTGVGWMLKYTTCLGYRKSCGFWFSAPWSLYLTH